MKRHYLLWLLLISAIGVQAQTLIGSAGDVQANSNTHLSFSIGEPLVETLGSVTVLTQGFQQVDQNTTDIPEAIMAEVSLYPNPCRSELLLRIETPGNYEIRIADMAGRTILEQRDVFSELSNLDVGALNSGLYVLQIREIQSDRFQSIQFQKVQ